MLSPSIIKGPFVTFANKTVYYQATVRASGISVAKDCSSSVLQ
jgi:hypothetical protein